MTEKKGKCTSKKMKKNSNPVKFIWIAMALHMVTAFEYQLKAVKSDEIKEVEETFNKDVFDSRKASNRLQSFPSSSPPSLHSPTYFASTPFSSNNYKKFSLSTPLPKDKLVKITKQKEKFSRVLDDTECQGQISFSCDHQKRYGPFGFSQAGQPQIHSDEAVYLGKYETHQKCLDECIDYYNIQQNVENLSTCQYEYWEDTTWGYYQKCFVYNIPDFFPSKINPNSRSTSWLVKTCSKDEHCNDNDDCTIDACDIQNKRCSYELSNAKRCKTNGQFTVLALRIIGLDSETSQPASKISDSLFGTDSNKFTMVSQLLDCSYNTFHLVPYFNTSNSNENAQIGVREVKLNENIIGIPVGTIQSLVLEEVSKEYTDLQSQVDFLMMFIPPGTVLAGTSNWKAYAYLNNWLSVYNDDWTMFPSIHIHEIGHNVGLGHSHDESSYGDESCMMGASYYQKDGPKICFNAPKSWQLGWYRDTQLTIDADSIEQIIKYRMYGISEYTLAKEEHAYTAIKVTNTIDNFDYYISFNHKSKINSDVNEGENEVLVAKRLIGYSYSDSYLLSRLNDKSVGLRIKKNGEKVWIASKTVQNSRGFFAHVDMYAHAFCAIDEDCDDNDTWVFAIIVPKCSGSRWFRNI